MAEITRLEKPQYQSYPVANRSPAVRAMIMEELEFYRNEIKGRLGVICRDKVDNDFSIVVLEFSKSAKEYCATDTKVSLETLAEAREQLFKAMSA